MGVATTAALSSCTLPPQQAWRKIQDDGLIAYINYEISARHTDTPGTTETQPAASPATVTPPAYRAPAESKAVQAPVMAKRRPVERSSAMDTGKVLTAENVPSLPGFVRSPYTNPPRLVDVKGVAPGTRMVCPYTQKPFIVPTDIGMASPPVVVQETPRKTEDPKRERETPAREKESPGVVLNNKRVEKPRKEIEPVSDIPSPPSIADAPVTSSTPTAPAPPAPPSVATKSAPAATTPPAVASTPPSKATTPAAPVVPPVATTTPPAAPKPVQDIPYGNAIAGRPGFVNSPYAAKHQLVDVTGLPSGMEVKCPYTGKLFRVPMQDMASSKPAEPKPLASPAPEAPEKK